MNNLKTEKDTLRDNARIHRERLNVDESDFERIVDVFFQEVDSHTSKTIALYWPMKKEFDGRFLMDELVKRGFTCVLPVATRESRVMTFRKWTHDTEMSQGEWHVPEPKDGVEVQPDIVLAPLLAFDQKGYRLGYGGGHYDNTMAALRRDKEVSYIGLGYAEQAVLLKLPREAHDIPLDAMLTPQGLINF